MDTPEAHAVVVSRRVRTMPMTITSSLGGMSAQSRLSAAQQEARQAQDTAQRLRSEADAAQRSADREQERASGLNQRSQDASRRSVTAQRSIGAAQSELDGARRDAMPPVPMPATPPAGAAAADYVVGQYLSVLA